MEILIAARQITVDSNDLLDQEEENARFAAKDDPEKLEQIRLEFESRRQTIRGIEQFSFSLGPPDFVNQMQALDFARDSGLWDGKAKLSPYTYGLLLLLYRISDWEGFEAKGKPLPCTPENKVLVFGQAFVVIQALQRKLAQQEEAEAKNSETSAAG